MFLKIDHKIVIHQKLCDHLLNWSNPQVDDRCYCKLAHVPKGTKICLLRIEDGIAYITTEDGKIGCLRATWWTILVWRFNTVVIRNIKDWNGEDLLVGGLLFAFFFGIGFGIYGLIQASRSDGQVDFCTVQVSRGERAIEPYYYIEGHRPWRSDTTLFYAKTREEADNKKREICPR